MKNIAIVTGATGGLGREFARLLLRDEIDEIWAIARNVDKLEALREELGEKVMPLSADLAQASAPEEIEALLREEKPCVKFLVNNAGGGRMAASREFTPAEIRSHLDVHCTAAAALCSLVLPYMERGSRIVNLASQSAFQPVPYINLYAASKAFLRSYSRALHVELQGTGITCTAACPGWIKTDLLQGEHNGKPVRFPALAEAGPVAASILRDAERGKDMSVYGAHVKWMHLLAKILPQRMMMRGWMRQIREYL